MRKSNLFSGAFCALMTSAVWLASCHNVKKESPTFELTGSLSQAGEGIKVYLDRLLPDTVEHLDSTTIDRDGNFTFRTTGIYKGFYTIRITDQDYAALILVSTEKVHLTGNAQNLGYTYDVSGSPDSKLFREFNMESKDNLMERDSMQNAFEAIVNTLGGNKKRIDSLGNAFEKPYDSLLDAQNSYIKKFVRFNITSFASLAAIQQLSPDKDMDYYNSLDNALTKLYPNSIYVKIFHAKTGSVMKLAIGGMAPEITLPDTSGNMVSLSSLRGKTVLIDFWASWCEPCKESLPGLVKIYNKYKDGNFTIYSVSLDKFKPEWEHAIRYFNLTWTQVSDLKYWNSKVVSLYGFDGIPYTVLVSPEGKILDKQLNDSDLDNELHDLLVKKK